MKRPSFDCLNQIIITATASSQPPWHDHHLSNCPSSYLSFTRPRRRITLSSPSHHHLSFHPLITTSLSTLVHTVRHRARVALVPDVSAAAGTTAATGARSASISFSLISLFYYSCHTRVSPVPTSRSSISQSSNEVMMVSPTAFGFNEQAAQVRSSMESVRKRWTIRTEMTFHAGFFALWTSRLLHTPLCTPLHARSASLLYAGQQLYAHG